MEITQNDKQVKLDACGKIRTLAATTCLYTFQHMQNVSHKVSEEFFANFWNKELEKSFARGYVDSWYDPPPGGMAVLFAQENDVSRMNYDNLRQRRYWPNIKSYLRKDGMGYVYSSPYAMVEGVPIIGDFGMTFYSGNNENIKKHYRKSYSVLNQILENISVGMTFSQTYRMAEEIIKKNSLINYMIAVTDKAGTDMGHTVPFIDHDPTPAEMANFETGEAQKINSTLSHARRFISSQEDYRIGENCAFTFEPRLIDTAKTLPLFSFHQIVRFIGGKKIISDDFRGLVNFFGMKWIYE